MAKLKVFIRIVLKAMVFLLIFSWLLIHISYIVRPELAHTRNNMSGFYNEPENTLDVVFIGGSGTMSAYAPMTGYEEYGITSYNFCTNEKAYETFTYSIDEVLTYQSPKVLVLDVRPFVRNVSFKTLEAEGSWGGIRENTDGLRYSKNRYEMIKNELPDDLDKTEYYFDILNYHSLEINLKNWNGDYHYKYRGYNFLGWGTDFEYAVITDEVVPMDEDRQLYLDKLLAKCDEVTASTDTQILFTYYPYAVTLYNDDAIGNLNYIQQYVEDYGYSFVNFLDHMEELNLNLNTDFWNGGHWSIYGSEKITVLLSEYMIDEYDLPDHRGEEGYEEWEEDRSAWDKAVNNAKEEIDEKSEGLEFRAWTA